MEHAVKSAGDPSGERLRRRDNPHAAAQAMQARHVAALSVCDGPRLSDPRGDHDIMMRGSIQRAGVSARG
jgi:hypothetical protein